MQSPDKTSWTWISPSPPRRPPLRSCPYLTCWPPHPCSWGSSSLRSGWWCRHPCQNRHNPSSESQPTNVHGFNFYYTSLGQCLDSPLKIISLLTLPFLGIFWICKVLVALVGWAWIFCLSWVWIFFEKSLTNFTCDNVINSVWEYCGSIGSMIPALSQSITWLLAPHLIIWSRIKGSKLCCSHFTRGGRWVKQDHREIVCIVKYFFAQENNV